MVRQSAFQDETQEPSSPRLNVRFLPTIPSAPDSSVQLDEEQDEQPETPGEAPLAAPEEPEVKLPTTDGDSSILSSPKSNSKPP